MGLLLQQFLNRLLALSLIPSRNSLTLLARLRVPQQSIVLNFPRLSGDNLVWVDLLHTVLSFSLSISVDHFGPDFLRRQCLIDFWRSILVTDFAQIVIFRFGLFVRLGDVLARALALPQSFDLNLPHFTRI